MKTVSFKTLGCKVNQYETEAIREQFLKFGFEEIANNKPSDFYIINTCTVTEKADSEARRLIRQAIRQNPRSKIIVTGCYVEMDSEEIKKINDNLLIVKNSEKSEILQYLLSGDRQSNINRCLTPIISRFEGRTKAFVKVQDGCDNFCSYCKVPLVRGRSRSRKSKEIIQEISQLVSNGYKEIILTGICLGDWRDRLPHNQDRRGFLILKDRPSSPLTLKGSPSYHLRKGLRKGLPPPSDGTGMSRLSNEKKVVAGQPRNSSGLGLDFLLDDIVKNVEGEYRIRLSSIEPWYVTQELLKKVASSKLICRHLHIPMQSGDDEILKWMNRHFTSADFVNLVNQARQLMPDMAFTTDILVGFPGETEEQFSNTLKIVEATRPSRTHIFPFSRRQGTRAYNFGEIIPAQIVQDRITRLKSLTNKLAIEYKVQFVGRPLRVLVETSRDRHTGMLTGYTDTYIKASFQGPDELKGKFTKV